MSKDKHRIDTVPGEIPGENDFEDNEDDGLDSPVIMPAGWFGKVLMPLEAHNARVMIKALGNDPSLFIEPDRPTGIACPKCGNELSYEDTISQFGVGPVPLPAKCPRCGHGCTIWKGS